MFEWYLNQKKKKQSQVHASQANNQYNLKRNLLFHV